MPSAVHCDQPFVVKCRTIQRKRQKTLGKIKEIMFLVFDNLICLVVRGRSYLGLLLNTDWKTRRIKEVTLSSLLSDAAGGPPMMHWGTPPHFPCIHVPLLNWYLSLCLMGSFILSSHQSLHYCCETTFS